MPITSITGNQIKDESIDEKDIKDGSVRGSTADGIQREIAQGTISTPDVRDSAITKPKIDLATIQMTGATDTIDGSDGLVPKPIAGDNKGYLRGDKTWDTSLITKIEDIEKTISMGGIL